ncbi:uncharacterized protein LOC130749544 [Lotus japonicus]|uniref:uncharacterized protein LOC130749544 n=1 Tax=Lotus japonicus TaxID=34305 RepID=UPI002589E78C|nr:uncharacterized protein LOC130749544 [Lotus japonicus]
MKSLISPRLRFHTGTGGILRYCSRQILGVFSSAVGVLWAYEAELKAILNALIFCKQFQVRNLIIESDSALTVEWVNSDQNRPWKLNQDLIQLDMRMSDVGCLGVNHIYREANNHADKLAKSGAHRANRIWAKF